MQRINLMNPLNLKMMARFFAETIDKIASALNNHGEVPLFLFSVRNMLAANMDISKDKLEYILNYVR